MRNGNAVRLSGILLAALLFLGTGTLRAGPIDLNDFFADPTVTVAADGSFATIEENPLFSPVLLSNDPGLGDPNVILPTLAEPFLRFDFNFVVGASGNADEFGAFVIDAGTGTSAGPAFEFFTQATSAGTVLFDLSSLIGGPTLGLQFQLSALPSDADFDSKVTVSSVAVTPEPGTLIELGTVVLVGVLFAWRRRKTI